MNPTTQRDAAVIGFESIILLVHRYQLVDNLRRPDRRQTAICQSLDTALVISDLENKIIQLYGKIYEYQIRLVRQYSHVWAVRFGRDIFKADDWAKMIADMRLIDADCSRLTDVLGQDELERSLKDNNRRIDDLVHRWHSSLQTLQTDVDEISTTIYQQIQQEKARKCEERDRDCIQLFRLGNRYEDQKNRIPNPHPNTCRWFLDNSKFLEWRDNESSSLLWVSADPGCGKSVLSRSLVDGVLLTSNTQDATVCYFFFKDISIKSRSITTALAAIIHQLCSKKPSLIEHALSAYNANGSELPNLFDTMWDILVSAAADPRAGEIVCVLDALDECEESQQVVLIEKIKEFYNDDPQKAKAENVKIRFLLTSRPYQHISARFHTLVRKFPTIHLSGNEESDQISEEIQHVIRIEVAAIASERLFDAETEKFLLKQLLGIQNRTYLWLHLILDQIRHSNRASNTSEMRREILALPQSISTAYEGILGRTTDRGLATKVLHIIVGAERPLTVQELNVAMSIEDDSRSYEDLQMESENGFALRIRNLCGLFISVDRSTVYLIHQTAKDFLIRREGEPEPVPGAWQRSLLTKDSQIMIVTICLSFFTFIDFRLPSEGLRVSSDNDEIARYCYEHTFFEYASMYWIEHINKLLVSGVPSERWKDIACLLDVESLCYQTWTSVYRSNDLILPLNATSVIVACYFGFKPVLEHFIPTCPDINHQASYGATAINYAVNNGDTDMVRILLENGADIKGGNWENPWRTEIDVDGSETEVQPLSGPPMWMAALREDLDMIRFLVNQGASIDARDAGGMTALQVSYEFREIADGTENIHVLLDCGADVNLTYDSQISRGPSDGSSVVPPDPLTILKDMLGPEPEILPVLRSLLLSAVYKGDADAVELFLKYGADPARISFTVGIVDKQLKNLGVDTRETSTDFEPPKESLGNSSGNSFGDSLIHSSNYAEHDTDKLSKARMKPLEEQAVDDWIQSMLQISEITVTHIAVSRNETRILASLLSYDHHDNPAQSFSDDTPETARSTSDRPTLLHLAAILGHSDIVALLLDVGVLEMNARDHQGETALTKAIKWGREGIRDLIEMKMSDRVKENRGIS